LSTVKDESSTTSGSIHTIQGNDWQSSLPLDWTRMKRGKCLGNADTGDAWCPNPDNCRRWSRIRQSLETDEANLSSDATTTTISRNFHSDNA